MSAWDSSLRGEPTRQRTAGVFAEPEGQIECEIRDYIINHGLSSAVDWSPTWAKLQLEVNNDDPFVVLNDLTTSGHYITTVGYYATQHTAVFNHPYGNKNTPGYPSYDGAGVLYDWPGYNNGFRNLNTVHCFIYCRGGLPPLITGQPLNQTANWQANASFGLTAVGEGTLSYRWQKGTTDLTNYLPSCLRITSSLSLRTGANAKKPLRVSQA